MVGYIPSQQATDSNRGATYVENYRVVWSPALQAEVERAAQRPAPELPKDTRGHVGNKGHITLPEARHTTSVEDVTVVDLRSRWLREKLQT